MSNNEVIPGRNSGNDNIGAEKSYLKTLGFGPNSNSVVVEVNKPDMSEIWDKYPDALARAYDPGAGLCLEAWIERK